MEYNMANGSPPDCLPDGTPTLCSFVSITAQEGPLELGPGLKQIYLSHGLGDTSLLVSHLIRIFDHTWATFLNIRISLVPPIC